MPLDNRTCFTVNLRDALQCRRCGAAPSTREIYHRGFEYHHVQPRSCGGEDRAENVILLCHECHTALHQNRIALENLGDLTPTSAFQCAACEGILFTQSVAMNCGWYLCGHCNHKTHLFDHFYLTQAGASTREDNQQS
jgi:hypothetical protein